MQKQQQQAQQQAQQQNRFAVQEPRRINSFFARGGGFTPDQAQQEALKRSFFETQADANTYEQQQRNARNIGLGNMLYSLSDAFAGRNIGAEAQQRQANIQQRQANELAMQQQQEAINQRARQEQEEIRKRNLATDLRTAIQNEDFDKAYAISAELTPGTSVQSIDALTKGNQWKLSNDGTYQTRRNPETNEIEFKINDEIVDLQKRVEKKSNILPSGAIEKNIDNEKTIETFSFQNQRIDQFIKAIEEEKMQFGPGENIEDFFGNLGIGVTGEESQERLGNKNSFERWKQSYVNKVLQAAKGPQTDGDAKRAFDQLKSANTKESVISLLKEIKEINQSEIRFNEITLNSRNKAYGQETNESDDSFKFRVIE